MAENDRKTRKVDPADALKITGGIDTVPLPLDPGGVIKHSDLRRYYNMMSTNQDIDYRNKKNK